MVVPTTKKKSKVDIVNVWITIPFLEKQKSSLPVFSKPRKKGSCKNNFPWQRQGESSPGIMDGRWSMPAGPMPRGGSSKGPIDQSKKGISV